MPPQLKPDPGRYAVLRAGQEAQLAEVARLCAAAPVFGFDTETTLIADWQMDPAGEGREGGARTVGYCLSWEPGKAVYVPFGHEAGLEGLYPGQMPLENVLEVLRSLLEGQGRSVLHNATFDYRMTRKDGLRLRVGDDTAVMAKLISWGTGKWDPRGADHGETSPRSLKSLTEEFCGWRTQRYTDVVGEPQVVNRKKVLTDFATLSPFEPDVYRYAAADASNTICIRPRLLELLEHYGQMNSYELERRLIVPNADMRQTGIHIDFEMCKLKSEEGDAAAEDMHQRYMAMLSEELGREVEIDLASSKQLRELFFSPKPEGLALPVPSIKGARTKSGEPSTNKAVLAYLAREYPVVGFMLAYRGLTKNLGTYLKGMPGRLCPWTGRVHPNWDPLATETGRYACSDPNMQNLTKTGLQFDLPGGGRYTANVRDIVIASPSFYLFDFDYSQIEYRAMAGEAQEMSLVEGWRRDPHMDVHARTASILYGIAIEAVSAYQRDRGKTMNFALIYGRGAAALAEALGITLEEAQAFIEDYFAKLPAFRRWISDVQLQARREGYVTTKFGWRRCLPEFEDPDKRVRVRGDRLAVNTKIQGVCAQLMKIAIVRLHDRIAERGWGDLVRPVMTVHDSLVLEIDEGLSPAIVYPVIADAMVVEVPGWPPVVVDAKIGYRYGSTIPYDPESPPAMPERHLVTEPPSGSDVPFSDDDDEFVPSANGGPVAVEEVQAIVIESPLDEAQAVALVNLLASNPGPHPVRVHTGAEVVQTALTTSLDPASVQWTQSMGRVRVRWDSDDVDDPLKAVRFGS